MEREVAALEPLIRLAERSAATWRQVRGEAFAGETTIETRNTVYRFEDGLLVGRTTKSRRGSADWNSSLATQKVELIGFLADEGGFWSFSPRWREGALAVMTADEKRFLLTSPTCACAIDRPRLPLRSVPERSDVFHVPGSRPPVVRRPAPPSMTRIQLAPASGR